MPSVTFTTPGIVSWTVPLDADPASIEGECWAAAGSGNEGYAASPGGGGGGGEYAADFLPSLVPGVTYYGQIGQGGPAGTCTAGGNTTFAGLVTANGGDGGTGAGGGRTGKGGTGSTNTVHHNGGNGGSPGSGGGGGGGGSGAPSGPGNNGGNGGSSAGGTGATALSSGGGGAPGGASGHGGGKATSPGGGGGGGGKPSSGSEPGSAGADGQIRITWTSTGGSSGFPSLAIPFFPAGRIPSQADLNSWFHDPFAYLETRAVFRARQAVTPQSLPTSGSVTLEYDTVDEDPLAGWVPSAWAWGPPDGFSGWYAVTVTLATAALAAGNTVRPGITAPGSPGVVATGYPGAVPAGVQGSFWVYLVGGQDTVQATGTLLNASAAVNTSVTAGAQSSMEITWISS